MLRLRRETQFLEYRATEFSARCSDILLPNAILRNLDGGSRNKFVGIFKITGLGRVNRKHGEASLQHSIICPRGSRYQIIKALGPKSHDNHGLYNKLLGPSGCWTFPSRETVELGNPRTNHAAAIAVLLLTSVVMRPICNTGYIRSFAWSPFEFACHRGLNNYP